MFTKLKKVLKNPLLVFKKLQRFYHSLSEIFYAYIDSKNLRNSERVLFVDLGANLGQGFKWFSRYYNSSNIDFELFEPNPFCFESLSAMLRADHRNITLHNFGAGVQDGKFKFFGLSEEHGGKFSQGGSIVKDHNSDSYESSDLTAIEVSIINFSKYLLDKKKYYEKIVVKMDIEGAEVELLENLILNNSINFIDYLYVEFHSQFQEKKQSKYTKAREENIMSFFRSQSKVKYRIWH